MTYIPGAIGLRGDLHHAAAASGSVNTWQPADSPAPNALSGADGGTASGTSAPSAGLQTPAPAPGYPQLSASGLAFVREQAPWLLAGADAALRRVTCGGWGRGGGPSPAVRPRQEAVPASGVHPGAAHPSNLSALAALLQHSYSLQSQQQLLAEGALCRALWGSGFGSRGPEGL